MRSILNNFPTTLVRYKIFIKDNKIVPKLGFALIHSWTTFRQWIQHVRSISKLPNWFGLKQFEFLCYFWMKSTGHPIWWQRRKKIGRTHRFEFSVFLFFILSFVLSNNFKATNNRSDADRYMGNLQVTLPGGKSQE